MKTVNATYKAAGTSGRIEMSTPALPIELNKMIIWIMLHQDEAQALLPEYERIRAEAEGSGHE